MTDKEIIKTLDAIEDYSYRAYSEIDELKDRLKASEELVDFLIDLSSTEEIPQEIRTKADELWRKVL